jgi:hypothetical protein
MHRSPKFQSVSMALALVPVVAAGSQVHRERAAAGRYRAVNGTRSVPLISRSGRRLEVQLIQGLFHADLRAEHAVINARHVHLLRFACVVKLHREEAPVLCLATRRPSWLADFRSDRKTIFPYSMTRIVAAPTELASAERMIDSSQPTPRSPPLRPARARPPRRGGRA